MIFDQLAGIVERHLPQFIPVMKKARIFRIDNIKSVETTAQANRDTDSELASNFKLPFEVVALEETSERHGKSDRCTVLSVHNDEEKLYNFLMCASRPDDPSDVTIASGIVKASAIMKVHEKWDWDNLCTIHDYTMWSGNKKDGLMHHRSGKEFTYNNAQREALSKRVDETREKTKQAMESKDIEAIKGMMNEYKDQVIELKMSMMINSCHAAMLCVILINQPTQFIVEESLVKQRKSKLNIERSDTRPHYVVLAPGQIKKRFIHTTTNNESETVETGKTIGAHERRGHYRKLQSDRYINAKGKTIWVKAMWIGPSEAVINNNRYKVMLDL